MQVKEYNWSFDSDLTHPVGRPFTQPLLEKHRRAFRDMLALTPETNHLYCISASPEEVGSVVASTAFRLDDDPKRFVTKTIVSAPRQVLGKPVRYEQITTLRQAIELSDATPLIHSLRAPVSRLVGLIDLLARDADLSADAREYVAYLMKTAGRMRRTVDYLLISAVDPTSEDALRLLESAPLTPKDRQWLERTDNSLYMEVMAVLAALGFFAPQAQSKIKVQKSARAQCLVWDVHNSIANDDTLTLHAKLFANQALSNWLLKHKNFSVLIAQESHRTRLMVRACSPAHTARFTDGATSAIHPN